MNRDKICKVVMIATDILLLIGIEYIIFTYVKTTPYNWLLLFFIPIIYVLLLAKDRYDNECTIDIKNSE